MAWESEAKKLRRKVGYDSENDTALPLEEAGELLDDAALIYTDTASQVTYSAIVYLEEILASAAKMNTYKQNQTTENSSDLFDQVLRLIKYHKDDLASIALGEERAEGTARFGQTYQIPTRWKEYPNS